ncbi:tyrosine-type recombinase/integrase [Micromonospora sp. 4G57]|uniref:Tyrosine-type recombinase/integrase n=1 Tax=Micromonospora sicca TaxID=2202420 RepID=A0ABU5JLT7_9ACTN|nr:MULTISPECIES: tyrosine-type recombinase/integrase [unclassified Micromonospora]MDZ5446910.1 tyrosine-type recombinase/integrase [Micromonospora sp. 4G57]MDZ5493588.1 tyrosine-type recombinase/integrase [Micromonospora sp. 4G53]
MPGRARANGEGSIFPYRNGFAAYVWVTKPDGRRTRKYVYGKTREAVHEKWIKLHQQAKAGPVATSVPTVGSFLTRWLTEIIQPNRAPLTYATYETFVRRYIAPGLGAKRLDRLQSRDVQTWINQVARTCQCCAQGKDAARPKHKRRCCAVGRCCQAVPSTRTVSDIRAALRAALTAAYALVLVTGLRKGEALGLTWEDIDLDAGELTIGRQLQRVRGKLLHRDTKTQASDATLPLPDICMTALKLRSEQRDETRESAGKAWQESDLVFTTRYGTPIEPRNFQRSWQTRCDKARVKPITVHDARRTCATLLADLDVHPRVAMQVLRHARFSVTMEIYTQVSSTATREALKRLGDSLGR